MSQSKQILKEQFVEHFLFDYTDKDEFEVQMLSEIFEGIYYQKDKYFKPESKYWQVFRCLESQQAKIDELQKRVDEVCDLLDRAEINHRHLLVKYQSTKLMEYNASKRISDAETQIAVHWGADEDTDSVLRDVEKALRGEHD